MVGNNVGKVDNVDKVDVGKVGNIGKVDNKMATNGRNSSFRNMGCVLA